MRHPRFQKRPPAHARSSAARLMWACAFALLTCAVGTRPGRALDVGKQPRTSDPSPSLSSGLPWEGKLLRAVRLRMSSMLRPVADYARNGNFYGTAELVSLLERAAHNVSARWPGSTLAVGELSAAHGGRLDGHHSHRTGRDADIAFFMRDAQGGSSQFARFVTFGGEGIALHTPEPLYFDDARNWALVASMLRDPDARVQYLFVAKTIRTRLLMEARRQGEGDAFMRSAAAVLVEPKERHKHDNHFHVRIYCARDDRPVCRDVEPYWPWYDGEVPGGQHAQLPLVRWRAARSMSAPP